jgi:hypothetical protein
MSLDDLNLKDEHLRKALQHAPDSDVTPSDVTRKTVLDYADKSAKTRHEARSESWFLRLINVFNNWQVPRWQLAGMGSLAASLLVVVMIWHENPDDPMQVATAPTEINEAAPQFEPRSEPTLAQNKLAKEEYATTAAPEAASAEMAAPKAQEQAQDKIEAKVVTKAKPAKQEAAEITRPPPAAIEAASGADSTRLKERAVIAEVAPPTPVAAAPATVAEPAPASVEASTDSASEQTARAAPTNKAARKMAEAEVTLTESDASRPAVASATAAKPAPETNTTLAQAISQQGGKALANQDIQAGRLRILDLSKQAATVDDETGYRIEFIADDSGTLATEVAAYNQTMRDWYLNQNK